MSHGVGHFLPEAGSGVTAQSGSAHNVLSACSALGPTITEGSVSPHCGSPSEGRCHLGEQEGGGLSLSSPTSWLLLWGVGVWGLDTHIPWTLLPDASPPRPMGTEKETVLATGCDGGSDGAERL